jgi:hypothetical protein
MNWWQTILLFVGACGGLPAFIFVAMLYIDRRQERRLDATREARAEELGNSVHGEAVSAPRPAVGIAGLREALDASPNSDPPSDPPHQGWRT